MDHVDVLTTKLYMGSAYHVWQKSCSLAVASSVDDRQLVFVVHCLAVLDKYLL
jgi:hypothetical protein